MAFSTTSFFAGVGTAFVAITLGFAGGAMITASPKVEPNRVERVAANAPIVTPAVVAKSETSASPSVPAARADVPETPPATDRVIALTQPQNSEQNVAFQPRPPITKEDAAARVDDVKKVREGELRRDRAEARRERRKRQEIQAAANAVRQLQRDGRLQEVSEREDTPRLGFFGN